MPLCQRILTASAAKHAKIVGVRIASQSVLDLDRQVVEAARVGMADRRPYLHTRGNRDHRCDNARTTAAAKSTGTESGIRTRTLPVNATSIAGSAPEVASSPVLAAGLCVGAISAGMKPAAGRAPNSCR